MQQERNKTLREKVFKRDNFTCQKCGLQDKSTKNLEAHHILLLGYGGTDELDNLITLCFDCHKFAPNKEEDFKEYMKEECEGTMTLLLKSFKKIQTENPELFRELDSPNK